MTRSHLDVEREFRQTLDVINHIHSGPYVSGRALQVTRLIDKLQDLANEQRALILSKGHVKHVQKEWYDYINAGTKTVEGRLAKDQVAVGDILLFHHTPPESANNAVYDNGIMTTVKRVSHYLTFAEYLEQEGLSRTLPGVRTLAEGVEIYRRYYSEAREREFGVMAIEIEVVWR